MATDLLEKVLQVRADRVDARVALSSNLLGARAGEQLRENVALCPGQSVACLQGGAFVLGADSLSLEHAKH